MVDSVRQNPDMRDQFKCSECRRKKVKCTPRDRDWEKTHEKCDNCKTHDDAPCGPNHRRRNDPAVSGLQNEVIAHEEDITQDVGDRARAPIPQPSRTVRSTTYIGRHNKDELPVVSEESSGQRKRKMVSDKEPDELHGKARSLLDSLNSLGRSYAFGSQFTPVICHNRNPEVKYNKRPEDLMKGISDIFHSLFMEVCQLGFELHERGMNSDADRIFMKLLIALEIYPGLADDRKNGALNKMASFYRELGGHDTYEWILTKAAEAHDDSIHQENPCPPLVASLIETSRRADHDLHELWEKYYMVPGEVSLAIPPIQRSAQHKNAGVASRLLARPNSIANYSLPALFNQEGLHIAATRGEEQILKNLLRRGVYVDAPDILNHTALYLAAAKGHEGCCAELIKCKANPNRRDSHGTTILEVAAGAGHFKVVQRLVNAGAEVNPVLPCCTSSPLQAAVENPEPHLKVALYLMGKNGDVSIRRMDGKNAIDLAKERCGFLTAIMVQKEIMRQKELLGPPGLFEPFQTFCFNQGHLDFSSGLD